jgi:hypothetical protein
MEAKIKEVQKYFKDKILSKDFTITSQTEYIASILVEGKYKFTLWIGNFDIPECAKLYESNYNAMSIEFNQKERIKLHGIIKKDVMDFKNKVTLPQKLAELERLKKELNIN